MRVPPASTPFSGPRYRFFLFILLISTLLCGIATAEVLIYPSIGRMISDEWDGGDDLGREVTLGECSGAYDERVCIANPETLEYTLTIPPGVNMDRVLMADIRLEGWGLKGNYQNDILKSNDIIFVNYIQYTDWPFNQPLGAWGSYEWGFALDPDDLHNGVNDITYEARPYEYENMYGNTIYGDVSSVQNIVLTLEFSTPPSPELNGLMVSPTMLVTGHDITVTPLVSGESPDWEITDITYYVMDKKTGAQDFKKALPNTGDLTYRPAPGTYGEKELIAKMHVMDTLTGAKRVSEVSVPITIYFDQGNYPDWVDDDGDTIPNWFEYWVADSAVPLLDNTVNYDATESGFGQYKNGNLFLYPEAAYLHYQDPIVIPTTTLSPEGESFGGPSVEGIDCAAEVIAHERYHKWVDEQWLTGGDFFGKDDSDYDPVPAIVDGKTYYFNDHLPDFYEETVSMTNSYPLTDTYDLQHIKNPTYFYYGDEEYMAMRAGDEKTGTVANDWAYPGKQAGGRVVGLVLNPPVPANCAGKCDIYAPQQLPDGVFVGIVDTPNDPNANTLYDTLTAGNDITINRDGMHEITAVLTGDRGSGPEVIAIQRNQSEFTSGNYSIQAVFPGTEISSAGIAGPFTVNLTWRHEYLENSDPPSRSWQTASYFSTEFEPVGAGFTGTATASSSSGDLLAEVPLTINKDGEYTIEGYLQDPDGVQMAHAADTATFLVGAPNANLVFDGNVIAAYHRDGTYRLVNFRIIDSTGTIVSRQADVGAVTISSGDYGDLQTILTGYYDSAGAGLTDDGRYGILDVVFGILAPQGGDYYYSASLYDEQNNHIQTISGITTASSADDLILIPLDFSGKLIYNSRVNGTYSLRFLEVYGPSGSDQRSNAYVTQSYNFTEFAQPTITITGNVTDYPVDLDSDTLYDAIRVGFDVDVGHTSGASQSFPLSANLTGSGGKLVARASSSPSLARDTSHHVTLDFAGTTINGMDIDGPYTLTDLRAGSSYTSTYDELYHTAAYDPADFEPAAILNGFVWNETGYPISGVRVSTAGNYQTAIEGAGYYRLIFGEEMVNLAVSADPPDELDMNYGYIIHQSVTPGTTTWCNFTLFSNGRVYGTVKAENGTILTAGTVIANGPHTYTFNLASWGNGSYRISSIENSTYDVFYSPPTGSGLVSDRLTDTVILPGENREWNITAYNKRSLSGTVKDIYGDPLEEAAVSLTAGPITRTWPSDVDTDATGAYSFQSLIPGTYTVQVEPPWDDRNVLAINTTNFVIDLADTDVTYNIVLMPEPAEPVAGDWISCNTTGGPPPLTVSFEDRASGYPTAWLWDFGDGETSAERRPVHTYTDLGIYNITLTVSNAYGSDTGYYEDGGWIWVEEEPVPEIQFATGTLDPGASGLISISANTIPFQASRLVLDISFDPAVVQFNNADRYPLMNNWDIDATNIDNVAGTAEITVYFVEGATPLNMMTPLANLNFTAVGSAGEETQLTADPADWLYFSSGWQYNPLSVTNGTITINGGSGSALPVPSFAANLTSGSSPLSVAFDSSISDVVTPTAYLWTFGDGNTSVLADPVHSYEVVGTHDVALQITNSSGSNTTTMTGYITVTSPPSPVLPVPVISANATSGTAPLAIQFSSAASIVTSPTAYLWTFGDGDTSVLSNPSHSYIAAGTYDVALRITNSSGSNTTTMTGYITVTTPQSPVLPIPVVSANATSGTVPLAVQFSSASSVVPSPTAYLWTFGDGDTSVLSNPSHRYITAGTYNVALSITNSSGTNTTTRTSYITASPAPQGALPRPAFTADTTSGAVPLTVQFTSTASDALTPTGYLWQFGDGSTSVLENPSHVYTTIGVYGVSLRIANTSGFNTTTRARYISTHSMVGTNASLPLNSTITGDQISVNLTGAGDTEVNGDQIILNNQGGFNQIIFFTSGVTNTTGNLTGTVTGVQLTTPLMTANIPEGAVTFQANISASSYNSGGEINFTFVGADENLNAAYQSLLGSQLNETALVFEITATGMDSVTGSVLTFTVPDSFRERNSGGIAVIWTHAGTSTVLTATYLGSSGGISTYQITVPGGFSTFGVVGMGAGTSPPAPSSPASPSSVDSGSFSSYSDSSPVSKAEPVTGTQTVNVGGSSAIRQVTVTGTGIGDLVVSAYSRWSPTSGIPELTVPVYQYLEINPARYTTITSATIRFSVPQQWVDEKQITADTIELYHYTAGQWKALPTHWEKTENDRMYFTAESDGFSLFAIAVRSAGVASTVPESRSPQTFGELAGSPTTGPVKISSANTGQSPLVTETVPVQSQPDTVPGYMVPVLIAGAVAAILFGSVVLVRRWWIRRQNPALFRDYD